MAWSFIVYKNAIKNWSTALQAFSSRSLSVFLYLSASHSLCLSLSLSLSFSLSLCIRSSHWRCSVKQYVLRNFANFTGKQLCQSFFFNKVAGLEFCKISKNTFSTELSFISFFTKARIILQFLSLVFSMFYTFSPFSFNALI